MTKQRKPQMIYKSPYKGYDVNVEVDDGRIIFKPIIDNTFRQLESMLDRHYRVFTFRFDLHLPSTYYLTSNRDTKSISILFNRVTADLKKKAKSPRVAKSLRNHKSISYQWAKEKGLDGKHHFHCWIATDGNINYKTGWPKTSTKEQSGIAGLLDKLWKELTGGSLEVVRRKGETPGRMLTRKDRKIYEQCIYHYSYMTKVKDKYHHSAERYSRNHGCSHLSRQSTTHPILEAQIQPITTIISPRNSHSPIATNNRIKPHIRDLI